MTIYTIKQSVSGLKVCVKLKKREFQKQNRARLIEIRNKPKECWKTIKSCSGTSTKTSKISNSDWIKYFQTLFAPSDSQPEIDQNHPLHNITQNNNADCLDFPFTETEIRPAINKLKSDRSGGPDGLCIGMFKSVIDDITQFLVLLFNDIYNSGHFPEDWCQSITSPIHKSLSIILKIIKPSH